jgi:hypothetical protein
MKIVTGGVAAPGILKDRLLGVMRKKGGTWRRMLHCRRMMGNIEERKISGIESVKTGMFHQAR